MRKKRVIGIGIFLIALSLFIYFFWETLTFIFIGLIGIDSESKRIEITPEYIKTGWMLQNTTKYRLAIQPIDVYSLKADTAKFEDFIENVTYTANDCMTLFGKDGVNKIYFNKRSKGWTWDKICDLKTEKIINQERTYILHNKSFYRILSGYWRGDSSYKIFIYVDDKGNVQTFMKPRDGKSL